jgi:1,4-alpha-glucan branching enzyme
MITRERKRDGSVKVTFSLPHAELDGKVSVVGDFNDWDPAATPMRKRGETRSASVVLDPGRYAFRYVTDGGRWIDEDGADGFEANEFGSANAILDLNGNR